MDDIENSYGEYVPNAMDDMESSHDELRRRDKEKNFPLEMTFLLI